jgi:glycosyltransferase involved in cell wall biosynthesis
MPSYYESFGMPVLEALINKISVICSNTGALPEITKELALYFNPYNAKDISSKMEIFIENYSEIIKKTERWHENYARMFTLKLFHYNYNKMFFKDKIK